MWPRSLLKGSDLDQFLGVKCFGGRQPIITSMHGLRKIKSYLIMPFGVAVKLIEGDCLWQIIFLEKMGIILKTICMEGQGHIFTIDLIFSVSTYHAKGSCIQWMVLLSKVIDSALFSCKTRDQRYLQFKYF